MERKARFTGKAAVSTKGEQLTMFMIGKSTIPHCSKNVKNLPCEYNGQKKSWMNGEIFEEWIRKVSCI